MHLEAPLLLCSERQNYILGKVNERHSSHIHCSAWIYKQVTKSKTSITWHCPGEIVPIEGLTVKCANLEKRKLMGSWGQRFFRTHSLSTRPPIAQVGKSNVSEGLGTRDTGSPEPVTASSTLLLPMTQRENSFNQIPKNNLLIEVYKLNCGLVPLSACIVLYNRTRECVIFVSTIMMCEAVSASHRFKQQEKAVVLPGGWDTMFLSFSCTERQTHHSVLVRLKLYHTPLCLDQLLVSIVVSIPACHAGDRGSIPRRGEWFFS